MRRYLWVSQSAKMRRVVKDGRIGEGNGDTEVTIISRLRKEKFMRIIWSVMTSVGTAWALCKVGRGCKVPKCWENSES